MKQTVKGLDKLAKKLQSIERAVAGKILRTELRAAAKEVAVPIKELAPQGETGMLKRAIRVRAGKRKKGRVSFVATIDSKNFPDQFYGPFVDLGTSKQEGQHFEEKGFDSKAEQLAREVPQRIAAAIKREAK